MKAIRKLLGNCWHLLCACVPGCGQMCQGYMKRRISQTILFSVLVFISVFLEMGVLSVLAVPLWAYSFFDSYNLRRQIREGYPPEDDFMFGLSEMDARKLNQLIGKRHSLIGWILVAVGFYNVYQIFARRILGALSDLLPWFDWLYGLLVWDAPRILGTVLVIALGLWFIKGPRVLPEEDPPYTPPKNPEKPPEMKPSPWTKAEKQFHEETEPQAPDPPVTPVTLTWKSEFDVERFEKEAARQAEEKEEPHGEQ